MPSSPLDPGLARIADLARDLSAYIGEASLVPDYTRDQTLDLANELIRIGREIDALEDETRRELAASDGRIEPFIKSRLVAALRDRADRALNGQPQQEPPLGLWNAILDGLARDENEEETESQIL